MDFLFPLPAQTGHFTRIKATPSDLPFMSIGFSKYPVPLHRRQASGFNPFPLGIVGILYDCPSKFIEKRFSLRIPNKRTRAAEG
jgi:hypothetical protein